MSKILFNNYAIYYYLQAEKTHNIQYDYEQILKQLLSFKIVLKYSHAKTKISYKTLQSATLLCIIAMHIIS